MPVKKHNTAYYERVEEEKKHLPFEYPSEECKMKISLYSPSTGYNCVQTSGPYCKRKTS